MISHFSLLLLLATGDAAPLSPAPTPKATVEDPIRYGTRWVKEYTMGGGYSLADSTWLIFSRAKELKDLHALLLRMDRVHDWGSLHCLGQLVTDHVWEKILAGKPYDRETFEKIVAQYHRLVTLSMADHARYATVPMEWMRYGLYSRLGFGKLPFNHYAPVSRNKWGEDRQWSNWRSHNPELPKEMDSFMVELYLLRDFIKPDDHLVPQPVIDDRMSYTERRFLPKAVLLRDFAADHEGRAPKNAAELKTYIEADTEQFRIEIYISGDHDYEKKSAEEIDDSREYTRQRLIKNLILDRAKSRYLGWDYQSLYSGTEAEERKRYEKVTLEMDTSDYPNPFYAQSNKICGTWIDAVAWDFKLDGIYRKPFFGNATRRPAVSPEKGGDPFLWRDSDYNMSADGTTITEEKLDKELWPRALAEPSGVAMRNLASLACWMDVKGKRTMTAAEQTSYLKLRERVKKEASFLQRWRIADLEKCKWELTEEHIRGGVLRVGDYLPEQKRLVKDSDEKPSHPSGYDTGVQENFEWLVHLMEEDKEPLTDRRQRFLELMPIIPQVRLRQWMLPALKRRFSEAEEGWERNTLVTRFIRGYSTPDILTWDKEAGDSFVEVLEHIIRLYGQEPGKRFVGQMAFRELIDVYRFRQLLLASQHLLTGERKQRFTPVIDDPSRK